MSKKYYQLRLDKESDQELIAFLKQYKNNDIIMLLILLKKQFEDNNIKSPCEYLQKYLDDKIAHTTINEESKVAGIEPPEVKEYELEDNTNVIDKEIWRNQF